MLRHRRMRGDSVTEYRRRPSSKARRTESLLLALLVALLLLGSAGLAVAGVAFFRGKKAPPQTQVQPAIPTSTVTKPVKESTAPSATPAPSSIEVTHESKPQKAADVAKTLPDEMVKAPTGTQQIIAITGDKIGSKSGHLAFYEKVDGKWVEVMKVEANFGSNGLIDGEKRRTGNLETPTGMWKIGDFLFGLHSTKPPGTLMPYRPITDNSYWSSVRDTTYNTWVSHKTEGEHLIDADPQYEYAFNSGYNSPPNERVYGRGTAIFIHCPEPPGNSLGKYTHGCIAIPKESILQLFKKLDPDKNPTCAIGTLQRGSKTSIWQQSLN